jgi:hypothetical protein
VIVDPIVNKVLWVGRGRVREDVRLFFELLGEDGRKRLEAVVMNNPRDSNPRDSILILRISNSRADEDKYTVP